MDGNNGGSRSPSSRIAKPLRVEFDRLTSTGKASWNASGARHVQSEGVLHVLVGSGRGCVLQGNSPPPLVLLPLRGRVHLTDGDSTRIIRPGEMFVADSSKRLQVFSSGAALWITVVAPAFVWRQLFDATMPASIADPVLLPATHTTTREIRRAAVHLARDASRRSGKPEAIASALRFAMLVLDLQSEFASLIKRCPGRTLAQRRGVFLRLQRVYHSMQSNSDFDLGVAGFARAANYSSCHFVRTFRAVYGETPHAVVMEQRLRRALRLIEDTELSITEVARACGFDDRCAFARAFKKRFHKTATAVRERRDS